MLQPGKFTNGKKYLHFEKRRKQPDKSPCRIWDRPVRITIPFFLALSVCASADTKSVETYNRDSCRHSITAASQKPGTGHWPTWEKFATNYIEDEGRVVEDRAQDRTTSEGQAYALFFALVANDRRRFNTLLDWTNKHLSNGFLGEQLPAWLWGRTVDGEWGILDLNSASDADLWLAYSLLEASRLWDEPGYHDIAIGLLHQTRSKSLRRSKNIGYILLPAPEGFQVGDSLLKNRLWRLNPSYVPPFLFARLQQADPSGPWSEVALNHSKLVIDSNKNGLVPDWLGYAHDSGSVEDPDTGWTGSYDAIRLYLWTGLWPHGALKPADVAGMRKIVEQDAAIPETINVQTLDRSGTAPPGFYRALLPYLAQLDSPAFPDKKYREPDPSAGIGDTPDVYYDYVLTLFGTGWAKQKFAFGSHGQIIPDWLPDC